jgi:hypothetical protein
VTEESGALTEIRPHGSTLGLLPFGPQVLLLAIFILIAANYASTGRWAGAITLVLSLVTLLMWQALYHWRARIIVRPDRRIEIRGRFITRVVNGVEIQLAVLYGLPGNQAVAYLDRHDRRPLTLRLAYWTLGDVNQLNDALGILLNDWDKSRISSPPGKGLLPFLERHRNLVGAAIPLLFVIALVIGFQVWSRWPT